ncbi:MAG TPA: glycosyl hydrolase family 28 protein, partial [Polyangia bacterium]|nr:glycosyl hydrolase family 28 protein [Polyangia bacterium]
PTGGTTGVGGARASGGTTGTTGTGGTIGSGGAGPTGGTTGSGGSPGGTCGAGDPNLPAEPTLPASVCTTLSASRAVAANGVPAESSPDTSAIQTALSGCGAGKAVKLVASGSNNAFLTGPIRIPSGVTLWVDKGVTLFGTRDPAVYGASSSLITVTGTGSGIVGDGVIDGQGGEPNVGSSQSWWDQNAGSSGDSPALIQVAGASQFTLYRIRLQNSPKFHVKLSANGFVVWGVAIKTPSRSTNSAGTALTYSNAHNTDGIDPGEAASNGTIACSTISVGDDQIAIKGSSATGVTKLTIAHNHFGAGHGMSIGSEFTGGVSDVKVYDLSIDNMGTGTSGGSSNGIRIKSDSSRGGLVNNISYSDVCMRNVSNVILLTPFYSTATGSDIPQFTNITLQNVHAIAGGSNAPKVTLDGYDASHLNSVTLDNVIVDGVSSSNVSASYTKVTLGPGNVNFMPSGTGVTVTNAISGTSTPNPCTGKWITSF